MIAEVDRAVVGRAKRRLDRLYRRLGNWRAVARELGFKRVDSTVRYVWAFMTRDVISASVEVRRCLKLPAVLPSEKRHRVHVVGPLMGQPGWEGVYLRPLRRYKVRRNPKLITGR